MAPVAAASRPPERPKLRSKVDGRPGLPALYTARNLDRCTRQLGHWNPFASSAAASPEHNNLGEHLAANAKLGTAGGREEGQQPDRNPNLGSGSICDDIAHPMLALGFRSMALSPECRQFPHRCRGIFEFGKVLNECGAGSVQERRIHSWSKRRKQLSHALARRLWRWKDGFHARKRMKRCGPRGSRNSGSDKSSDRAPYGLHASDTSTAPTSKPGPFKWSDFPVPPTDSSGELFNYAGCWLGNENHNIESGYGSEPGYRGDEELEFADKDEQDEEEIEPEHLRMWTHVMACNHAVCEV
ncbi:hypothetical protein M758_2G010200 [Ceratodon purpureus]|nr:hypothetical protein M758_2G010200 [Ceratodon purpureus]